MPTNDFKVHKLFSDQVSLMMLLTSLQKMILCEQYVVESCALHCYKLHN